MPADAHIIRVHSGVCRIIDNLMRSPAFEDWRNSQAFQDGDLVAFNNSFLYRTSLTNTTKSKKYLCMALDPNSDPTILHHGGTRFNNPFNRISRKNIDKHSISSLQGSIAEEMEDLGVIIFSLVGNIAQDRGASIALTGDSDFSELRYEPSQARIVELRNQTIFINRLDDIDLAWRAIDRACADAAINSAKLAETFEERFGALNEAAGRPIETDTIDANAPSLLGEVVDGIHAQVSSYDSALTTHLADPDDVDALNEVMRIAYNFADGAKSLVSLFVGVSDLKPLISWLTINAQFDMASRFENIPFFLAGKTKPSFDKYRSVVAGARSHAFHDMFSFSRPFDVALGSDAIQSPMLKLFRKHNSADPAFDYKDRPLVELLTSFSRAREQTVPVGFWEHNLIVMKGLEQWAVAFRDALLLVSPESASAAG